MWEGMSSGPSASCSSSKAARARVIDGVEDVPGAQRKLAAPGVVIAVDGGERLRRLVGDAHRHQPFILVVGELARRRMGKAELHRVGLGADTVGSPAAL